MSTFPTFTQAKDPDDIRDYSLDWVDDLETGETIASATWSVVSGDVVIDSDEIEGTVTTARFSGGTLGTVQLVQCRITTSDGEQFDRSRYIDMRAG